MENPVNSNNSAERKNDLQLPVHAMSLAKIKVDDGEMRVILLHLHRVYLIFLDGY